MDRITGIVSALQEVYKKPEPELKFSNHFELIVAVILSAQCTDKRVNLVTSKLFKICPDALSLSSIDLVELENIIKPCGFYHNKAKALKSMACDLVSLYNGEVPADKEKLKKLAGVGEKTANVVLGAGFSVPAIAVDTHVFRVSNRLGLAKSKTPSGVQKQLEKILPKDYWVDAHHSLVLHGRYVCKSRKPDCVNCKLRKYCKFYEEQELPLIGKSNKK